MDSGTPQGKVGVGVSIRLSREECVALVRAFEGRLEDMPGYAARNLTRLARDLHEMAKRRGWLADGTDR